MALVRVITDQAAFPNQRHTLRSRRRAGDGKLWRAPSKEPEAIDINMSRAIRHSATKGFACEKDWTEHILHMLLHRVG